jgi:hypothetical protein
LQGWFSTGHVCRFSLSVGFGCRAGLTAGLDCRTGFRAVCDIFRAVCDILFHGPVDIHYNLLVLLTFAPGLCLCDQVAGTKVS